VLILDFIIFGRKIGSRTTVWAESEMIDRAAWEFEKVTISSYHMSS